IRRSWEDVRSQLPETVTTTYTVEMAPEQQRRHQVYAGRLAEILARKMLTAMDLRQIQTHVLRMRMVANSTFLVDRDTQVSPKLRELSTIIDEVVVQNHRKIVIFSEWTAMTFLVARHLSEAGIGFVEVSGKVETEKRHALAEDFTRSEDCRVFLTTDAGSAGLDLSCARCMVNVELPWTPSQAEHRRQRLTPQVPENADGIRPETEPRACHIINLIGAGSIEEPILRGLPDNPELFTGIFGTDPEEMTDLGLVPEDLAAQLKNLLGPDLLPGITAEPEDIPEENPYILFPEGMESPAAPEEPVISVTTPDHRRLEQVLNAGFEFISGLTEMATGQNTASIRDKKISVDPDTGEVSISFKLPDTKDP
ncbi:MAG: SWF/SNF helicase family protein, partial [Desulfobacterales bacterium]|nr:SWF/SNF helicase family protein [Desulfobacterales bacterium]